MFQRKFIFTTATSLLLLIALTLIINSCKKDLKANDDANFTAQIIQAKTWYEGTYPLNTDGKLATQSSVKNGSVDFSKLIAPDWAQAVTYSRLNKDVIEIPIFRTSKFGTGLKDGSTGRMLYKKEYTRSTFLLLNDGKGYKAYVMTIMADSDYINNDFTKLARNTYRKRDDNFSGIVLYFTPDGKLVNGWRYRHGQLITSKSNSANSQNIQNADGSRLKTNTDEIEAWDCTNYYLLSWDGNGNLISAEYLYSDCTPIYSGAIGGGGGDGDDNGGNSTPPADPCETVNGGNPTTGGLNSAHQLKINTAPNPINPGGGGDGGFPPPSTTDPNVCTVPANYTIITDSLTKYFPCATKLIIEKLLQDTAYNNFVINFTTTQKPDLIWVNGTLPWNDSNNNYMLGQTSGNASPFSTTATITLNTSMLQNSSQLLIAAAVIHETLHAYINFNLRTATFNQANNYSDLGTWLYGIDSWATINGLPPNYSNHYEIMDDYFDKAVAILGNWDNHAHTAKEYQMAMLYGLDNAGDGTAAQKAILQTEYNSLLSRYKITSTDLASYYHGQLNASSLQKLPTTGC